MVPHHDFTPHGYLDNPYHSWKLNPSGVLRSMEPLGMGWHVPNLGSYVNNQFQYSAHLTIGLKIGKTVLVTPDDFRRQKCVINSTLHTRNGLIGSRLIADTTKADPVLLPADRLVQSPFFFLCRGIFTLIDRAILPFFQRSAGMTPRSALLPGVPGFVQRMQDRKGAHFRQPIGSHPQSALQECEGPGSRGIF